MNDIERNKSGREINLLETPHGECHARLVRALDEIGPGDTALVVADHDTKPVFYQYQAEQGRPLTWQYEQAGPATWKIRVTKGGDGAQPGLEQMEVRHLPPPLRHKLIFEKFDSLRPGEGFILINDHDPKPLYYELRSVRGDVVEWSYVEPGPHVWRVRVIKTKDAPAASGEPASKLDLRRIPIPDRHASIFHRFGTLRNGESLEILNDHDPRPLREHFRLLYDEKFSWDYLEQGPYLWRVKIARKEPASPPAGQSATSGEELDVRPFPPSERHRLVFEKFDELTPGDTFVLINDHDPKPLYYQLAAEYDATLRWEYLEKGPGVWRVVVGRGALRG